MPENSTHRHVFERHRFWVLFAATTLLVLLLSHLAPEQMPLVPYKALLPALGALNFYWLDRALFPYAQPDGYLDEDWLTSVGDRPGDADYPVADNYLIAFLAAQARQVLLVCAGALAVSLGL